MEKMKAQFCPSGTD
uniref:Uncharacterized protein n=1 Tax=Arundo donax TaxID=35708 RepID=A0A0A9B360_ARUDO